MRHRQSLTIAAAVLAVCASTVVGVGMLSAAASVGSSPTFATDIAPIVYSHCVVCHRPGQAAPFALLTYDDVKKRGKLIESVTERRVMPPWHATAAPGFPEFRDERRLSTTEIATIKHWVEQGMPAGDLAKVPQPPAFQSGWTLGEPDRVLSFSQPIDVPADGPDLYRNVALTLDLPSDAWMTAIDYEPSARRVVHHALFFLVPATESSRLNENDALPGLGGRGQIFGRGRGGSRGNTRGRQEDPASGIGGWVPGMTPQFYPEGVAQPVPAHTNVVVQLHLHPSGKIEHEQGRIAIYLSKKAPEKSLAGVQVPPAFGVAMGIDIPAGERRYEIHDSFTLPVDVEALGARGHAHYLAKEMKLTATLPDGSTKGLLWIGNWDFGWQDSYFYKRPFTLPKGTTIDATIAYDNSSDNLRNPNAPPKRVQWGRGSTDEMGSMTLLVAAPRGGDRDELRQAQAAHLREQFRARLFPSR
jgi:hypothetical protein